MEEIKGYVEHIVYRNEDNGYTVFNLNNDDGDLTCVGKFHYIEEGELLELTGEYIVHKVYGTQLQVETSKVCQPEDKLSWFRSYQRCRTVAGRTDREEVRWRYIPHY